ncbi:MAG: PIN domain-containing protein [Microlunatus sp.]|nr:PIN domain-containing protein [Microlunatus sp.]
MQIVDVNVLIYAVNSAARHHDAASQWLTAALRGEDTVAFAWPALLEFLRISTNRSVFERPLSVDQAFELIKTWTSGPKAVIIDPTSRHLTIMQELIDRVGTVDNLTTDAHLAALAVEYGARIVSFDRDVERFGVGVVVPG